MNDKLILKGSFCIDSCFEIKTDSRVIIIAKESNTANPLTAGRR